jgi:DNA-binding NarL/FixJ family response regulator
VVEPNHAIKILVADDHPVVRNGLKEILATLGGNVVLGEAVSGADVLDKIAREQWNVVLLDITMPGMSGLDTLKEIKASHPALSVLVLSMHPEDQFAIRALRAGASGYLTKDRPPGDLIQAVRKVLEGGKYVSESLAEKMAIYLGPDAPHAPHETLSDREYEVLRLIAAGHSVTEISKSLALSVKTVSTYRARLLQKMGLRSNADLVQYAIRNNLF